MLEAAVVGGSGYTGGELLRLLLFHPEVEAKQVTSKSLKGRPVAKAHPNLRKLTSLEFIGAEELKPCDVLFLCLPHGEAVDQWDRFSGIAPRIIDLSADFRLEDPERYRLHYGREHPRPKLLRTFAYGIAELHRGRIRESRRVACAGCNATAVILALFPLYHSGAVHPGRTVVEVKAGSSEGGHRGGPSSHHPVRSGCLRSFSPTGHRHVAEIEQALSTEDEARVHFSATAVDQVRGILATCHVFLKEALEEKDLWKLYREYYGDEPFIRIVKERDGPYRYPEPKILAGTNFCDIGFERDDRGDRLVVISAIDNLMKGAAGQAVQNMNILCGFPETTGLGFPGLHPV